MNSDHTRSKLIDQSSVDQLFDLNPIKRTPNIISVNWIDLFTSNDCRTMTLCHINW